MSSLVLLLRVLTACVTAFLGIACMASTCVVVLAVGVADGGEATPPSAVPLKSRILLSDDRSTAPNSPQPGAERLVPVATVGRDGHRLILIDEDVIAFASETLYEVGVEAALFRVVFSKNVTFVENPDEVGQMLICRLPTRVVAAGAPADTPAVEHRDHCQADRGQDEPSGMGGPLDPCIGRRHAANAIDALVMADQALQARVARGIEDEHGGDDKPCFQGVWATTGTGSGDPDADFYELCYMSHFSRPAKAAAAPADADGEEGDSANTRGLQKIVFGRRAGSAEVRRFAAAALRSELLAAQEAEESVGAPLPSPMRNAGARPSHLARDLPAFNAESGRWELRMQSGDDCTRVIDNFTMPFQTTVYFRCGRRQVSLNEGWDTFRVPRSWTVHRTYGRCEFEVGIEANAVCEWDAAVRMATITPIFCNIL